MMKTFFLTYWKTITWVTVVSVLSLATMPSTQQKMTIPFVDKLVHFAMYFGMSYMLLWETSGRMPQKKSRLIAIGFSVFCGAAMEGLQTFTDARKAEWGDMYANTLGAIVGALIFMLIHRYVVALLQFATQRIGRV